MTCRTCRKTRQIVRDFYSRLRHPRALEALRRLQRRRAAKRR